MAVIIKNVQSPSNQSLNNVNKNKLTIFAKFLRSLDLTKCSSQLVISGVTRGGLEGAQSPLRKIKLREKLRFAPSTIVLHAT